MGTPDIAAVCLDALLTAGHTVVGAVCQPDRPKGRGHRMMPPPVKVLAEERGVPVYQPATLKEGAFDGVVRELAPDIAVVVAYGKILPASILFAPKHGAINVHASLLPRYRGAAPMQRAIMDGAEETGVTIMYMDEGLDTGDMIISEKIPLDGTDTFETLHDKTAEVGSRLLCQAIDMIGAGNAPRERQPAEGASYAEKITRADAVLDFSLPAALLERRVRGLYPLPLALTGLPDGRLLKVERARVAEAGRNAPAGTVLAVDAKGEGAVRVACGEGALDLIRLRPEGKGSMTAAECIRGRYIAEGDLLALPPLGDKR